MPAYTDLSKKYLRPSMIIFCSEQPLQSGSQWDLSGASGEGVYLYLTDDGRDPVSVSIERIENRQRMANGRMRTYHVMDKKSFSTGWTNLPSRAKDDNRDYISEYINNTTATPFGAGQDIKDWHEEYTGDFWMLFVYDKSTTSAATSQVELFNVFFDSFDFSISKRGQFNDLWDVNISLVEA